MAATTATTGEHTYEIRCIERNKVTKVKKLKKVETFNLTERYIVTNTKALGWGAFGIVCEATDRTTGEQVAIKKLKHFFHNVVDSLRVLRELKLLRLLDHENIVKLVDFIPIPACDEHSYDEIYMVFEYKETDLKSVVKSPQDLSEEHFSFWIYQMLKGLKYLDSAGVMHRDLKPENVLLDADSTLCIADLGLSRTTSAVSPDQFRLTEYVVTRYYRAPEVICDRTKYTTAVDVWAAGCILAEMLLRRVFLQGNDQVQQLALITMNTGSPTPEEIESILNANARRYMERSPSHARPDFAELFPDATDEARDLLDKMLVWNPDDRISVEDALEHPFVAPWREPETETTCTLDPADLLFDFEGADLKAKDYRRLIYEENAVWKEMNGDMVYVV